MSMLDLFFVEDLSETAENSANPGAPKPRGQVRLIGREQARTAVWAHIAGRYDVRALPASHLAVLADHLAAAELISPVLHAALLRGGELCGTGAHEQGEDAPVDWVKSWQKALEEGGLEMRDRQALGEALSIVLRLEVMRLMQG
jgi:hypothetical protein